MCRHMGLTAHCCRVSIGKTTGKRRQRHPSLGMPFCCQILTAYLKADMALESGQFAFPQPTHVRTSLTSAAEDAVPEARLSAQGHCIGESSRSSGSQRATPAQESVFFSPCGFCFHIAGFIHFFLLSLVFLELHLRWISVSPPCPG